MSNLILSCLPSSLALFLSARTLLHFSLQLAVIPTIGKDALALGDGDADVKISHISYKEPPKRTAGVKIQEEDPEAALAKAFEVLAADKVL